MAIFSSYWDDAGLNEKSNTTKRRYSSALHALGGYLVGLCVEADSTMKSASELLLEQISEHAGPLLHLDNESWQRELDCTAKALDRFLRRDNEKKKK